MSSHNNKDKQQAKPTEEKKTPVSPPISTASSGPLGGGDASMTKEEAEFAENLKDRDWRIRNLYYIKDKHGKKIKFKPNWAQELLLKDLWFFTIILKARQLGITTFFCILYLDQVLFSANKTAGIIAHKDKDAKKFFRHKVKFAWDHLPPTLKAQLGPPDTNSAGEMSFPNGSTIFCSTSTRSGTIQFLHISEFGSLCANYPAKAEEIVTGSINSVEPGNIVTIESTAEGRAGFFYEFCMTSQRALKMGETLSAIDFKFFFFPWHLEPTYNIKGDFTITREDKEYFQMLENKHNIHLTKEQKNWYTKKKDINKEKMFAEYPSIPEEAFQASIKGSYYASEMSRVYEQKRIQKIAYDSRFPVDTWWDLGMNDKNVIIFTQAIGNEIRFIDFYQNSGEGLPHYVNILHEKKYTYNKHTFPHDINVRELSTGKTRKHALMNLGITNIRTVERSKNILEDIEQVRGLFTRFYFDAENTAELVDAMANYKKEWNDKTGEFMSSPRHDKYSHAADAMRTLARGWSEHFVDLRNEGKKSSGEENFF